MVNPDPAFLMFDLCSHMKWAHLPVAGGLYDQDPELLRKFRDIFEALDEAQVAEQKKQEAEQARAVAKQSAGRSRGRRR